MEDIELVIKISEKAYNDIMSIQHISGLRSGKTFLAEILKPIMTGTPLPKVHGRLIDEDAVIEWLKDKDIIKMSYQENNAREDIKKSVPTIIEADKESEE